jgi:hypothetical protein
VVCAVTVEHEKTLIITRLFLLRFDNFCLSEFVKLIEKYGMRQGDNRYENKEVLYHFLLIVGFDKK